MDTAAPHAANGMAADEHELAQVSESLRVLRVVRGDGYEYLVGGRRRGVTESLRIARRRAASLTCSRQAGTAQIEQAQFIPGLRSLEAGYQPSARAPYWTGHRHRGGRKRTSTSRRGKPNTSGRMGSRP
jgi:hypothetical protein